MSSLVKEEEFPFTKDDLETFLDKLACLLQTREVNRHERRLTPLQHDSGVRVEQARAELAPKY